MMQLHAFWTRIQRRCWRDTSVQRKDAEAQRRREGFHRFALLPAPLRLCAFALNLLSNTRLSSSGIILSFSVQIRVHPCLSVVDFFIFVAALPAMVSAVQNPPAVAAAYKPIQAIHKAFHKVFTSLSQTFTSRSQTNTRRYKPLQTITTKS